MNPAAEIWEKVIDILRADLTSTAISTWFSDCRPVEISDGRLIVSTPTEFKRDTIKNRFSDMIRAALSELFSSDFDFLIITESEAKELEEKSPVNYNSSFTFENFVIGNSNKFAYATAKAVAENPAKSYNPLFIYGDSGLGKTHLLYAIGNTVRERDPAVNIIYIKGDEFTNELINAIQTNKSQEFHDKYRKADLLLVDDIQFIAGRIQTQEEFFNTFNTLYEDNKQIVLTSDRPPKEIHRLEERLQSRFVWGVLADIQPPDYETRMAIIRNKAQQLGIILHNDVAEYIAENVTANVRQLEGVVKKLMAYSELLGDNIDLNLVKRTIKEIIKEKGPSPEIIIDMTAQYYSLSSNDIRGKSQSKNIAQARKIAMYLIRKLLNTTLDDIGKEFNNRDHSTVLNAIRGTEENIKNSSAFAETIRDITANINART